MLYRPLWWEMIELWILHRRNQNIEKWTKVSGRSVFHRKRRLFVKLINLKGRSSIKNPKSIGKSQSNHRKTSAAVRSAPPKQASTELNLLIFLCMSSADYKIFNYQTVTPHYHVSSLEMILCPLYGVCEKRTDILIKKISQRNNKTSVTCREKEEVEWLACVIASAAKSRTRSISEPTEGEFPRGCGKFLGPLQLILTKNF